MAPWPAWTPSPGRTHPEAWAGSFPAGLLTPAWLVSTPASQRGTLLRPVLGVKWPGPAEAPSRGPCSKPATPGSRVGACTLVSGEGAKRLMEAVPAVGTLPKGGCPGLGVSGGPVS